MATASPIVAITDLLKWLKRPKAATDFVMIWQAGLANARKGSNSSESDISSRWTDYRKGSPALP